MNISKIRDSIMNQKGKNLHFKYNGSRNQIEEFKGTIKETYSKIFIIQTATERKSFSYSDILTMHLEILD